MADSQEQKDNKSEANDHDEANEEETTPSSDPSTSSKSKKKIKSKLKALLSRKPNEEIRLEEIQDVLASASLEDKKALSIDDQAKLQALTKKVNEMVPAGARKDIADHKFWRTQPVIRFGMAYGLL